MSWSRLMSGIVLGGWVSAAAAGTISEPVLKWQQGGCYASWCETGWYSSPAIVDVDGDGVGEIVASGYSIVALEGAGGTLIWRAKSGHDVSEPGASNVGRTWPGIGIADIDGDADLEVVLQTSTAGVVAFDLPGTAGAPLVWRTGRGSFARAGTPDPELFADGFESGSTDAWTNTIGGN